MASKGKIVEPPAKIVPMSTGNSGDTTGAPGVTWVWPTEKKWGLSASTYTNTHHAVDIPTPIGTPVWSPAAGKVVFAGWDNAANGGYGQYVKIQTVGGQFVYLGHLDSLAVATGATVSPGQLVGKSGDNGNSTGPHLHFEIQTSAGYGHWLNPVDLITKFLTAASSGGLLSGKPDSSDSTSVSSGTGDVSNASFTTDAAGAVVKSFFDQIKTTFKIKDIWLKPINIVAMLAGAAMVTIGVTGLVLGESAKLALGPVGEAIGKGMNEGQE